MAGGVDGTEKADVGAVGNLGPLFLKAQPCLRGPHNLGRLGQMGKGCSSFGSSPFLGPLGGLPLTGRLTRLCTHALYPPLLEANPDNCT